MSGAIEGGSFEFWSLLKSVSRSFYLSMRFLPAAMREPISVAYLLARASDTLADTKGVDEEHQLQSLSDFRDWICEDEGKFISHDFAIYEKGISHSGEWNLLKEISEVVACLSGMDKENQKLVRNVLDTITSGQKRDLGNSLLCCQDSSALLHYTYQVAGCVGEFWTEVGFYNLKEEFAVSTEKEAMLESGKKLGQALQLTNILRDLYEDIPNGRCYLPADELLAEGWDGESVLEAEFTGPVVEKWIGVCREFLEDGKNYVRKVRNFKARFATYLPLLLAEATIEKLEKAGVKTVMHEKVKISRWKVWACVFRAVLG